MLTTPLLDQIGPGGGVYSAKAATSLLLVRPTFTGCLGGWIPAATPPYVLLLLLLLLLPLLLVLVLLLVLLLRPLLLQLTVNSLRVQVPKAQAGVRRRLLL